MLFHPAPDFDPCHSLSMNVIHARAKSERLEWASENLQQGSCRDTKSSRSETCTCRLGDRKYFFWFATIFVLEYSSKQSCSTSMVHADHVEELGSGDRLGAWSGGKLRTRGRACPHGSNLVPGHSPGLPSPPPFISPRGHSLRVALNVTAHSRAKNEILEWTR